MDLRGIDMITRKEKNEKGFSYIDILIAIVVCMVGVLAMTQALALNMLRSANMERQVLAKQHANSALESIFAARDLGLDTGLKDWSKVGNVGSNPVAGVPQGIFLTGWRPVRDNNGSDGVVGTADDACNADTTCPNTGTGPQGALILDYERRIEISDLIDANYTTIKKRSIVVTVRYRVGNLFFNERISSLISDYN
jgi:type II secretory pathway pseudopilin PulG